MASTVEQCVINALKTLADAALQALKSALISFIALLEAELLVLIAQATPLQLAKQFLVAQAALVKATNDAIKNVSRLLPTGNVSGPCISLSLINLDVADRIAPVTGTLDKIENDILVLSSLVDLNTIAQRKIQDLIALLNETVLAIDEIINERNTPPEFSP